MSPRVRPRPIALIAGAAVVVAAVLAIATLTGGNTIHGTFVLTDSGVAYSGGSCSGQGGYSDIRDGTEVTVKDGSGTILATTALVVDTANSSSGRCAYTFQAKVKDADFYQVEVSHRGELTYSKAELIADGWQVGATLGG